MNRMKLFGITAGALLCLSLARPGAAADMAVNQGQSDEMVESAAEPMADGAWETASGTPVDFGLADTDLSNVMSHQALKSPFDPSPSARRSCDIYCCYCTDKFAGVGYYVCCFEGFCSITGFC